MGIHSQETAYRTVFHVAYGAGLNANVFLFSRPVPFPCAIVPRDKKAEELIVAETLAR
jgi:hypothetical protein